MSKHSGGRSKPCMSFRQPECSVKQIEPSFFRCLQIQCDASAGDITVSQQRSVFFLFHLLHLHVKAFLSLLAICTACIPRYDFPDAAGCMHLLFQFLRFEALGKKNLSGIQRYHQTRRRELYEVTWAGNEVSTLIRSAATPSRLPISTVSFFTKTYEFPQTRALTLRGNWF